MEDNSGGIVAANNNNPYRFYVYAWQYPDGRTFYVGKGRGDRDVTPKTHNPIFMRTVAKIRREGGEPRIVRWHEGLQEKDAHQLEVAYIKLFGRRDIGTGSLCNMTDGGDGTSGWVPSAETRAKMRASSLGNAHFLGRTHSAETRAKLSAARKGVTFGEAWRAKISEALRGNTINLGKPKSAEHRAKISEALRGKSPSEETRAKLSASNRGKTRSAEVRSRISEGLRGKTFSADRRARMSEVRLGKPTSAEHRAKIGAGLRNALPRSGLKGVFPSGNKWRARIKVGGKSHHIGNFPTAIEAAEAYDAAAIAAWGAGNCYVNFPEATTA